MGILYNFEEELTRYGLTTETYEHLLEDCSNKVQKISDLDWSEICDKYNLDFNPDTKIVSYNLVVEFIKTGFGIGYVTKEFNKEELKNNELSFAANKFVEIIMQK